MMKVAILYICTGKYRQFFEGFYASAKKYFLKGIAEVEYFVFTDDMALTTAEDVHLYYRECQGFPMDALMRYDMFLSIKDELKPFDYLFFFNSNMLFVAPVGKDFLPEEEGLGAILNIGYIHRPACLYPYERNKKSTAYIGPHLKEYHLYMSGLNGGKTKDYLKMSEVLSRNIHKDLDNGIIAIYHDESHLNKYLTEHSCKRYEPSYAYPEGRAFPYQPKVIIRDKTKLDPYFNKGRDLSLRGKIKKAIWMAWRAVSWYL